MAHSPTKPTIPAVPSFSMIELLEDRIAPATIVNPTTVTYQDIDGDSVVIKFSKGVFTSDANAKTLLTFSTQTNTTNTDWHSNATPESLSSINLKGLSGLLTGVNISVSVVPQAGIGNGQADVGAILAGELDATNLVISGGVDLGKVTIQGNLGYIVAGDNLSTPALGSLTVKNLGVANGTFFSNESSILGAVKSLHVTGDLVGYFHVYGDVFSNINNLQIDGALNGAATNMGIVKFSGTIGNATIGSIVGSTSAGSGLIWGTEITGFPSAVKINSLHVLGSVTGSTGASSGEILANTIGTLQIDGNLTGVGVTGDSSTTTSFSGTIQAGTIGTLKIAGNLNGGAGPSSGSIFATQIDTLQIGGNLNGSTGADSAEISVTKIGTLKIGGGLTGGTGANSAYVTGSQIGSLSVGGDIKGNTGASSGSILVPKIGPATIGGSLIGGAGNFSGTLEAVTSLGTTQIGGSLQGGGGIQSGFLFSGTTGAGTSVSIGGNITGGTDEYAGTLYGNAFSKISIHGSVTGGTGTNSGAILCNISSGTITIGGDLTGGSGTSNSNYLADFTSGNSGVILVGSSLGTLKIGGNVTGAGSSDDAISRSGYISANHIGNLTIGGSLIAGTKGDNSISDSGAIRATQDIGSLTIGADLKGDATNPAVISAGGFAGQKTKAKTDLAINQVIIGGTMNNAAIAAGYTDGTNTSWGNANDPDAQINSITIGGDLTASNIVAGATPGSDGVFGTSDDKAISNILVDLSQILSKISSIVVGGSVTADASNTTPSFGIVAQYVAAVKINNHSIGLNAGPQNDTTPISLGASTQVLELGSAF